VFLRCLFCLSTFFFAYLSEVVALVGSAALAAPLGLPRLCKIAPQVFWFACC
jgi:hypothetical protein